MPTVWFIRHGESESNANLRTSHPAESRLTEKGHREATVIAQRFTHPPSLFVLSPYIRAKETAVPTLERFPHVPQEEWPVYEFTYLAPIRYKDTTGGERRPIAMAYWEENDPERKDLGEGESFTELLARVQSVVNRVQNHPAEFIAIFSHGLFLRALLWHLITGVDEPTPRAMKRYSHFTQAVHFPNGAILKVEFRTDGDFYLAGLDSNHLQSLA